MTRWRAVRWALFCLLIALSMRQSYVWASSLAEPGRQTVPMTPPPTWTPDAPPATPEPTRPKPTKPPPEATPVPQPEPWLWLDAQPQFLAPGERVVVHLEVENIGGAPLEEGRVVLSSAGPATLSEPSVSVGQVQAEGQRVTWSLGALAPGGGGALDATAAVWDDALPDTTISLRAEFVWRDGRIADQVSLQLPWALLPETGGPDPR